MHDVGALSSRLPSGKIVMRKAAGGPPSSDEKSSSPGCGIFRRSDVAA